MSVVDRFEPREIRDRDDIGSNPTDNPTIGEIIQARYSRRALLGGLAGGAVGLVTAASGVRAQAANPATEAFLNRGVPAVQIGTLSFKEISHGLDATHHLSTGYKAQVLLRWGDKIFADAPDFAPAAQTPEAQAMQFGYNNDFVGYLSYKFDNPNSQHGLLCVNHEYTNPELMFPQMTLQTAFDRIKPAQVAIEMQAVGHSIVEIERDKEQWVPVLDGEPNRRITATTPIAISGPAAGSPRLATSADPSGTRVNGTIGNCGGGITPWGTIPPARRTSPSTSAAMSRPRRRRPPSSATAWRKDRSPPGTGSTAASMSGASRTRPTASAGSSKSIPTIRNPCR
jgi:secreted PhoX family phosphatase